MGGSKVRIQMVRKEMTAHRSHVIPVGGSEPVHAAAVTCWCFPLVQENGLVAVHHASDCREAMERQRDGEGLDGKPWVVVLEPFEQGVKLETTGA